MMRTPKPACLPSSAAKPDPPRRQLFGGFVGVSRQTWRLGNPLVWRIVRTGGMPIPRMSGGAPEPSEPRVS
jgi:hypothetical protein